MTTEPENTNPYASPAAESDPSFRDTLRQQRDAALQERRRRSAICMLVGCSGVVVAALLLDPSNIHSTYRYFIGTSVMLSSIGLFCFGQTIWTWIRPIQS